ncbi:MAG TPA: hypothetical protein VKY85_26275 [Candidatus Angelobacter sp.]|nr:hypothetical protein [Candidatus Angelobacter sp.]
MAGPFAFYQPSPSMYTGWLPVGTENLFYAVSGFEIRALPALSPQQNQTSESLIAEVLYRFQMYLVELHDAGVKRSVALQFMAHPEQAVMDSRVRIYILCRSAHADQNTALADVQAFAVRAAHGFPKGETFRYGQPVWLSAPALQTALFTGADGVAWADVDIVELRKFEDRQTWSRQIALHYVPHRYWPDIRRDPWLGLIETLAAAPTISAIRIEVNPLRLDPETGLDPVANTARWFGAIGEDLDRRQSQGDRQNRPDGIMTSEAARSGEVEMAASNASFVNYVQRGRHVYQKLVAHRDRLLGMRVVLAARSRVPDALIGAVRTALSSPATDDPVGSLGWVRPEIVRPTPGEVVSASSNLTFLIQRRWGFTPPNPAIGNLVDLRYIVTAEEAVSLFHLPVFNQPGQTSALSTSDTPFVIPPESLAADRFKPTDRKIRIGYLYQREDYLGPDENGKGGQPFYVTTNDLMKPSLLVGAPGSGKSNLAFALLIQFWRDLQMPFLVLDPSTGNEYRLLLREPKLKTDMVVFTVGDRSGFTLQFNPFSVPPGVTIRNHTTRILAAFQAAMAMPDPVPSIYDAALERLYCDERYCGKGRAQSMDDKGTPGAAAPTLSDFARAIHDELNENALTLYKGSAETIGIIRGASTVRIDAIGKKLGYILNTPANNTEFFQKLLQRPAVVELGALGDTANIALLMAFMVSQLSGHIEYQARQMEASGKKREHVMLIEEAHRLLAGGQTEGVGGKSAEDLNTMLAEIRKFGQGIMILDQRPSSLVGGVMDNAYIKILTRLSDRVGFERLSDELNLNEAQQRFAHSRLKVGQAILLDRDAGQPVLTRAEEIKYKRLPETEELKQMQANALQWGLTPVEAVPYVSPRRQDEEEPAGKAPQPAPMAAKEPEKENAREWLSAEIERSVLKVLGDLREDSHVYYAVKELLAIQRPDVAGAKAAVQKVLLNGHAALDPFLAEIWEKAQWAALSTIAEQRFPRAVEPIAAMRQNAIPASLPLRSAASGANFNSVGPEHESAAQKWLKVVMDPFIKRLTDMAATCAEDPTLKSSVLRALRANPADLGTAKQAAADNLQPFRGRLEGYMRVILDSLPWVIVGAISELEVPQEIKAEILQSIAGKPAQKAQPAQV